MYRRVDGDSAGSGEGHGRRRVPAAAGGLRVAARCVDHRDVVVHPVGGVERLGLRVEDDQPDGMVGSTIKVNTPILTNLRLDPYERMGCLKGNVCTFCYVPHFYMHEFWRFVFLQRVDGKEAMTFIQFPPMQKGASFNLDAVKAELEARIAAMKTAAE